MATGLTSNNTRAQILSDSNAVKIVKEGIGYIYNNNYDRAEEIHSELEKIYPGHPVNFLFKGLITYWKHYPVNPSSPERRSFEEDLRKCIYLCEQKPYSDDHEAESCLANTSSRGLLLMFFADNDLNMSLITLGSGTYKYIRKAFDFTSYFADFFFFTGLYNYYRETYPEIYPVYKPLASMFPHGDKIKGLKEVVKSAELSIFLQAESYSILSWIYTGFENNYIQAYYYSSKLVEIYPANLQYRAMNIKNLLLLKEYDKAEDQIINYGKRTGNGYYDAQILILSGVLQEKKYRNYDLAEQCYEKGIEAISQYGAYGNEYCGYAWLGLSRICESKGDKTCRQAYRRKGNALLDFKKVNFE